MHVRPSFHEYASLYAEDLDFQVTLANIEARQPIESIMQGSLLYKGALLCVPKNGDQVQWIRQAYTLKVASHFEVNKNLQNL